jgi:hypothetical protein
MSVVVPLSRLTERSLLDNEALTGLALAASLEAGLRHAKIPAVLKMLDDTRPPTKRFRRCYGRRIARVTAYARIDTPSFLELGRKLQSIALYDVRNRLPAVLVAYDLAVTHRMPTSRLFHNGLLSEYAVAAILSGAPVNDEHKRPGQAEALSEPKIRGEMKKSTTGTAAPHFIAGVDMPILPAEDDILVWFKRNYESAARNASLEIDDSVEIDRLLREGERRIAALEPKTAFRPI